MSQELLNNGVISGTTPGWEAILNNNTINLLNYIKTFFLSSAPIAGGRRVTISLQNASGQAVASRELLRVRVSDAEGFIDSATATVAIHGDTTLIKSFSANKDLLIKSNTSGVFSVDVLYTGGPYRLNIGPSDVYPVFANYHNFIELA